MYRETKPVRSAMKLSHVSIKCSNLKSSIDFYTHAFDAVIAHTFLDKFNNPYGYFLKLPGGGLIELIQHDGIRKNGECCEGGSSIEHFCIEVNSIEEFLIKIPNSIISKNVHRGRTDLVLQAAIVDPNGVIIELHQFDEQAKFRP